MKKIITIVVSFLIINNVYAFENTLSATFDGYLCSNDSIYPVYDISDGNQNYYFMNPSNYYNFDMRDYNEIQLSETYFDDSIRMFTSYNYQFNKTDKLNRFIYKMLWENTTGKTYYLCDKEFNKINYDPTYDNIYIKIKELIEGLDIPNTINVIAGREFKLVSKNIAEYNIIGLNSLNYYRPYSDTMIMNGPIGSYELNFSLDYISGAGQIYTDYNNYLLKEGGYFDKDQIVHINIDDPTLIINNKSSEISDLSNLCFTLSNNHYSKDFCSDETGTASVKLPYGIYTLTINNDINNDFNDDYISLTEFEKELTINWGNNEEKNQPTQTIEIIPSNTFELKGLLIISITVIGIIIVIKKILTN